jgi:quinol monooxygenase YgiN
MAVTVIWDTWLRPGTEVEGLRLTQQVWSDMLAFEGFVSHQLLIDQDAPGHLVVVARWRSREDADQVRQRYKDSDVIRQLTPLLSRPRERWVCTDNSIAEGSKSS